MDIHSHILPELDDGARSLEEAISMVCIAVSDGITDIIATPHTHRHLYQNSTNAIQRSVQAFENELTSRQIPVRVHVGAEVTMHEDLVGNVLCRHVPTVCDAGKYLLIELPPVHVPDWAEIVIDKLVDNGVTPIIVHPERNHELQMDTSRLQCWNKKGVLAQVTADALLGKMGLRAKRTARAMLKKGLIHMIASDAHDAVNRCPRLSDAYRVLEKLTSRGTVETFQSNAMAVLNGDRCNPPMKSNRSLFLLSRGR